MKRNQVRNIVVAISLMGFLCWQGVRPLPVTELYSSWDALDDDFKQCSPLSGAVWWETEQLKKMYYFGNIYQPDHKKLTFEGDKTIEVIHRLFHEVAGSFSVSTNKDYVAAHLSPKTIGKMVGVLEKYRLEKTKPTDEQLKQALIGTIQEDDDYKNSVAIEKKSRGQGQEIGGKKIPPFSESDQKKRLTGLCAAIVDSLQEQTDNNSLYYPSTTHGILLAVLYRKAEKRADLKDYFDALQEMINQPVKNDVEKMGQKRKRGKEDDVQEKKRKKLEEKTSKGGEDKDLDVASEAKQGEEKGAAPAFVVEGIKVEPAAKVIFDQKIFQKAYPYDEKELKLGIVDDDKISFEQRVVAGLFNLYRKTLPKIFEYKTVPYQGVSYPNCVETTARNLVNIACYDEETGMFDITQFPNVGKEVTDFYTKNKKSELADTQGVHDAWVGIVEDRSWVIYNNGVEVQGDGKQKILERALYMKVPASFIKANKNLAEGKMELSCGSNKIVINIIEEQSGVRLYNMRALLRNVIVQLDGLLGLKIFKDDGGIEKVFLDPKFNEKYFQKLLEALSWELQSTVSEWETIGLGGEVKLSLKKSWQKEGFDIGLSSGHGRVMTNALSSKYTKISEDNIKTISEQLRSLIVGIELSNKPSLRAKLQHNYGMDLFNDSSKENFLKSLDEDEQNHLIYAFAQLANQLDVTQDLVYQRKFVELLSKEVLAHKVMENFIKNMESVAAKAIESKDGRVRNSGKYLFKALFEKGQAFDAAEVVAAKAIESKDRLIRSSGINLYEELFKKGQAFEVAEAVAAKAIESKDGFIRSSGINLYTVLVEKDKAFDAAAAAAAKAVKSEDGGVQSSGLNLFEALVKKGQAFDSAEAAAAKAVKSGDEYIQELGIDLYEELVKEGQAFKAAEAAAAKAVESTNKEVQSSELNLHQALVEKGQAFDSAEAAAAKAIKSENKFIQEKGKKLQVAIEKQKKEKKSLWHFFRGFVRKSE